jgi:hypothetical protein
MNARIALFVLGLAAIAAMAVFGLTPLAWELQGRPSESYPELLFLSLGLPLATTSTIAGALLVWNAKAREPGNLRLLVLIATLALVGCGAVLVLGLAPSFTVPIVTDPAPAP